MTYHFSTFLIGVDMAETEGKSTLRKAKAEGILHLLVRNDAVSAVGYSWIGL